MTERHPLRRLAELLDNWDHATESAKQAAFRLEHDLAGGVHDAIFDNTSLLNMHGREHHADDEPGLAWEGDSDGAACGGDDTPG